MFNFFKKKVDYFESFVTVIGLDGSFSDGNKFKCHFCKKMISPDPEFMEIKGKKYHMICALLKDPSLDRHKKTVGYSSLMQYFRLKWGKNLKIKLKGGKHYDR